MRIQQRVSRNGKSGVQLTNPTENKIKHTNVLTKNKANVEIFKDKFRRVLANQNTCFYL